VAKKKGRIELAVPGRGQIRDMLGEGKVLDPAVMLVGIFATLLGSRVAGQAMAEKVLKRVGSTVVRVLGTGAMGVAFLLESGRVLKLTRDHNELEAAQALMRKRHPNITRFYDVFIARNGLGTGVIVRGSVDQNVGLLARTMPEFLPLAKALREATDRAAEVVTGSRRSLYQAMNRWIGFLKDALEGVEVEPGVRLTIRDEYGNALTPAVRGVLGDAIAGAEFLRECGIFGFDFHAGNVGVVMGEVGAMRGVIYDIGLTSSRARRGIDTERVTLEDILPTFGRMVAEVKKNPIPTVRV
jgi:hypothetical protein